MWKSKRNEWRKRCLRKFCTEKNIKLKKKKLRKIENDNEIKWSKWNDSVHRKVEWEMIKKLTLNTKVRSENVGKRNEGKNLFIFSVDAQFDRLCSRRIVIRHANESDMNENIVDFIEWKLIILLLFCCVVIKCKFSVCD